jgi:hypothetical protein
VARVSGGAGIDTLRLSGAGVLLDLNTVSAAQEGSSRLESIERIDLTGAGNNTLDLYARDVRDMSSHNLFNDSNGWIGLGASVGRTQVVVDGNAGDVVNIRGSAAWTDTGTTVTNGGHTYEVYNETGANAAQLLIDNTITVSFLP